MKNALLILLLSICLTSCSDGSPARSIMPDNVQLQPGDIVFRRGIGFTSRIVYGADRNGEYSHVGIVATIDGRPMVVHAVPDEPDFPGDIDRVKADTPEDFFSTRRASMGEVCRIDDPEVAKRAALYAIGHYLRHTPFDHDYDDSDTTQLYCCQLIDLAFRNAGHRLTDNKLHEIDLPGLIHARCLLPSDILFGRKIRRITQF